MNEGGIDFLFLFFFFPSSPLAVPTLRFKTELDSRANNPEKSDSRRPGKIDDAHHREENCDRAKSIYV